MYTQNKNVPANWKYNMRHIHTRYEHLPSFKKFSHRSMNDVVPSALTYVLP